MALVLMEEVMAENTNNYPETIIYTDKERVWCTGESNDHPRVYYTVPEEGYVVCGYCDLKFMRRNNENN